MRRTQGTSRMSPQQEAAGAAWSPALGSAARLQAAASGALGLGHLQGLPLDTARSGGLLMERAASAGTRHCPPGFPAMVPLVDCFTERVSCWCTLQFFVLSAFWNQLEQIFFVSLVPYRASRP